MLCRKFCGYSDQTCGIVFRCLSLFFDSQKESDNVEKPFLYLAEQFYQIYSDKVDMET